MSPVIIKPVNTNTRITKIMVLRMSMKACFVCSLIKGVPGSVLFEDKVEFSF